jgi:hypothetical protein
MLAFNPLSPAKEDVFKPQTAFLYAALRGLSFVHSTKILSNCDHIFFRAHCLNEFLLSYVVTHSGFPTCEN